MDAARLKSVVHRPAFVIAVLTVVTLAGFTAVTRISRKFHHHEGDVARNLFESGRAQLAGGNARLALADFRGALNYDHDNYDYELSLARALIASEKLDEARSYLTSLWERIPQDGDVNYELGQLAVRRDAPDEAVRFYHNAIYGIWRHDPDTSRRHARFALVDFLLSRGRGPEAQAELIAMSAALAPDAALHRNVAAAFMRAHDYEHALDQYRQSLALDRKSVEAIAGAGKAAFELSQFAEAERYLETAAQQNPQDAESVRLLSIARLVRKNDPFRAKLSDRQKAMRVAAILGRLRERLEECASTSGQSLNDLPAGSSLQMVLVEWTALRSKVAALVHRPDPEVVDAVVDLTLRVEQQAQGRCGPASDLDQALVLVAQNREAHER